MPFKNSPFSFAWACDWQVADLSMGDLLLHTTVIWLNPPASLGKWKKEPELAAFGTGFFSEKKQMRVFHIKIK